MSHQGPSQQADLGDALTDLLFRLLGSLSALQQAGRHLHPDRVLTIGGELAGAASNLTRALERIEPLKWPAERQADGECILEAARITRTSMLDFAQNSSDARSIFELYRALRSRNAAFELIFPLCAELSPVSAFFCELGLRTHAEAVSLASQRSVTESGVKHVENSPDQRAGYSIYSPFPDHHSAPVPLVVALHGGSGHGRDFLWSWVPAARSRGVVVIAPTSIERTWSLDRPDLDGRNIDTILDAVRARMTVDPERILLTGMSDGATFSYLHGLGASSPFSHIAPISGMLPTLSGSAMHSANKQKIHVVHGQLDWMFPVETAQLAATELKQQGADIIYTEIEDLPHTYPTEINGKLLEWVDPTLKGLG